MTMSLPLEGIRIIDLSIGSPGLYCTFLLGDLGAEVIHVQQPRRGAGQQRGSSNSPDADPANRTLNRNKKSLLLNLKDPEARAVFHRLAQRSDVVLEGFRPGVAQRLGIDYETLRSLNQRLIYCSLSGYGQNGPYRDLPGHDLNYLAMSGVLEIIGQRDGPPALPGVAIADLGGGTMFAAIGILVALYHRERTGVGQYIDVSLLDGLVSWLSGRAAHYFVSGQSPRRGEMPLTGTQPWYNCYETKDGRYITLGILEPWFWERLCRALGREELVASWRAEGEKREEILRFLRETFKTRTRDEWFAYLREHDLEVAPVNAFADVFADPQVLHRGLVAEMEDPVLGKTRQVGLPIKFSASPGQIRSPAPLPGQHTEELLQELGYSEEEISRLREKGAIG